jgi:hypothetical protein
VDPLLWTGIPLRLQSLRDGISFQIGPVHQDSPLVWVWMAASLVRTPCAAGWSSWSKMVRAVCHASPGTFRVAAGEVGVAEAGECDGFPKVIANVSA